MKTILSVIQIIAAIAVIVLVLLQERGSGVSESFGGTSTGGFAPQRRGLEKVAHIATIVGLSLFAATSLAILLIH